jgi:hypothetical protein
LILSPVGQLFIIKSYFQSWEFKREEPVAAGHHHLLGTEFCDPAPLNTSTPAFPFRDGFSLFFFSCTDIEGYAFVELTFSQDGKKSCRLLMANSFKCYFCCFGCRSVDR